MTEAVSGTRSRPITHEEEEALRRDPSTSTVLGAVQEHAGGHHHVSVRGDDRSAREVKDAQQKHLGPAAVIEAAKGLGEAAHFAESRAVEHIVESRLGFIGGGAGLLIGGSVIGLALGIHHICEAHANGAELREAIAKDELHVALLTQLDLPDGYKQEQFARRDLAGRGSQSVAQKMATNFATRDKNLVAVLQLHADRGMNAARDFLASGADEETYLKTHPREAKAYAEDAAFREGFDAMVWGKSHLSPDEYKTMETNLESRDARYAQAHVSYRV